MSEANACEAGQRSAAKAESTYIFTPAVRARSGSKQIENDLAILFFFLKFDLKIIKALPDTLTGRGLA